MFPLLGGILAALAPATTTGLIAAGLAQAVRSVDGKYKRIKYQRISLQMRAKLKQRHPELAHMSAEEIQKLFDPNITYFQNGTNFRPQTVELLKLEKDFYFGQYSDAEWGEFARLQSDYKNGLDRSEESLKRLHAILTLGELRNKVYLSSQPQ